MIKKIREEVPAVPAHIKTYKEYYCDKCGKEIDFPGSLYTPTVSYCDNNIDELLYKDRIYSLYCYHLCNDCIKEYIVKYLEDIGIKPYKYMDIEEEEDINV